MPHGKAENTGSQKSHMKPIIGLLMAHVKALNPTAIKASEDASESASRTIGRTIASTNLGQAIHSLITGVMCVCDGGKLTTPGDCTWPKIHEMILDHYLRKQF